MMINRLLASCAILALAPAMASAGGGSTGGTVIEQVQLGAQTAWLDVHVPPASESVTATSVAVSNSGSSILAYGRNAFSARQDSHGDTAAATSLTGGPVLGAASVTTTAYGNSANATTAAGDNHYRAEQVMRGNTAASTQIALQGAGSVSSKTVAAANVSVSGSKFGDNLAFQTQQADGSVRATTDAVVCCIATGADIETLAAGNLASSSGWTSTTYNGAVQTTGFDGTTIAAATNVYSASASEVTGSASASGNSFVLQSAWGYATLGRQGSELYQGNGAAISASSSVELDHWSGMAASIAYGVGNTALATNTGSDLGLNAIQSNFAGVDASASLAGQSWTGGTGHVAATAVGNVAGATLCNTCGDGALSGNVNQFNQGNISASALAKTPVAGHVVASASAIGNAATFTSNGH